MKNVSSLLLQLHRTLLNDSHAAEDQVEDWVALADIPSSESSEQNMEECIRDVLDVLQAEINDTKQHDMHSLPMQLNQQEQEVKMEQWQRKLSQQLEEGADVRQEIKGGILPKIDQLAETKAEKGDFAVSDDRLRILEDKLAAAMEQWQQQPHQPPSSPHEQPASEAGSAAELDLGPDDQEPGSPGFPGLERELQDLDAAEAPAATDDD